MNLIKQFREFGVQNSINPLSPDAQVVYYNLLQIFNLDKWQHDRLPIQTQTLSNHCRMTRKRLVVARNTLIQRGLIKYYQAKQASGSPSYELVFLYETQQGESTVSVFPIETHTGTQDGTHTGTQDGTPIGTPIKTKRNKPKQNTEDGADAPTPAKNSFKRFSEEEFKNAIRTANTDLKLPDPMLHKFFRYWSERSASGLMKFQMEKTWDTIRRLETWRDNQSKFERNGSKTNWGSNPVVAGVSGPGRSIVRDQL